jgi:hypothetical protein
MNAGPDVDRDRGHVARDAIDRSRERASGNASHDEQAELAQHRRPATSTSSLPRPRPLDPRATRTTTPVVSPSPDSRVFDVTESKRMPRSAGETANVERPYPPGWFFRRFPAAASRPTGAARSRTRS